MGVLMRAKPPNAEKWAFISRRLEYRVA